jgi:hypothetical protein
MLFFAGATHGRDGVGQRLSLTQRNEAYTMKRRNTDKAYVVKAGGRQ